MHKASHTHSSSGDAGMRHQRILEAYTRELDSLVLCKYWEKRNKGQELLWTHTHHTSPTSRNWWQMKTTHTYFGISRGRCKPIQSTYRTNSVCAYEWEWEYVQRICVHVCERMCASVYVCIVWVCVWMYVLQLPHGGTNARGVAPSTLGLYPL